MKINLFRWMVKNLGTLLMAFLLAVVVWISAVVSADPNVENPYGPVTLKIIGQDSDMLIVRDIPKEVNIRLQAPTSIWDNLTNNPGNLQAWIDLAGLGAGVHAVPVKTSIGLSPARILNVEPAEVTVTLETLVTRSVAVQLEINGEPPLGYLAGDASVNPDTVVISGPESSINMVDRIVAYMDIRGAAQTITRNTSLQALDKQGNPVLDVEIEPRLVIITQPITLLGGYKNVAVKVVTNGQVAVGYRLTNVSVSPPNVTVFSDNLQLINDLPGYLETMPVDLTDLSDDIEINTALNLPAGISLVSEPGVLVQIGVAAIEGSLTFVLPVEALGLPPTLEAIISPTTVDVIIEGPLPVLETLTQASFRVIVDLTNYDLGVYQFTPIIDLAPDQVIVRTILPKTVQVTIGRATPRTPTPTQAVPTVTPSPTLAP